MSRAKRRQRSTTIRKRIEKKQREEDRQRRKAQKGSGGSEDDILILTLPRESAESCSTALAALDKRLEAGSIRGWTTADLREQHGLAYLGGLLAASLVEEQQPEDSGEE